MKRCIWAFMLLGFCFLVMIACGKHQKIDEKIWADASKTRLELESISFLKPNSFKRSNPKDLKLDLPYLSNDSMKLTLILNRLKSMELRDSIIDIFVDTTQNFRIAVISNLEKTEISKHDAFLIDAHIKNINHAIELEHPGVKIEKLATQQGGKRDLQLTKFKYKMTNYLEGTELYNSLFYLNTKRNAIVLIEFSNDSLDLEQTMWSFRDE